LKVEFTGRQTEIAPAVRARVERRIAKLALLLPRITRAHVILTADKRRLVAEVTIRSRKVELVAQGDGKDAAASISDAMDKLLRQAQRFVGKRREVKRGPIEPGN
jgi:putative sigma-54 modulation protein